MAAERGLEEIGEPRELVPPALAPHAIYTVSEASLRWIAEDAGGARAAGPHPSLRDRGRGDATACETHGVRPAEYLDRLGCSVRGQVLAHGVWLDDAELELVAERGATVVTNPVANLKLAVGRVFPYPAARAPRGPRRTRDGRSRLQQLAGPARRT